MIAASSRKPIARSVAACASKAKSPEHFAREIKIPRDVAHAAIRGERRTQAVAGPPVRLELRPPLLVHDERHVAWSHGLVR